MAYSTCALVAALIPNILNGATTLDYLPDNVLPASAQIRQFMSSGCALIEGKINSLGYAAPGAGGHLSDYLGIIEAQFTAWQCEAGRSSPRVAKGERSRADTFRKAYEAGLRQMEKMDLGAVGLTRLGTVASVWGTGVSVSDKETIASNSDRVEPAFTRDGFSNPAADASEDNQA